MRKQALAKPAAALGAKPELDEIAERIRTRNKRMRDEIVATGRDLIAAKALAGHGGWLPWLKREFGWQERAARNFMAVAEAVGKSAKFADLNVPVSGLYVLAAPRTPARALVAVVKRSEAGEKLSLAEVKAEVAKAKPRPKPEVIRSTGGSYSPTKEQTWQASLGHHAGEAVSMRAFWTRTFGPVWRTYRAPSDLLTLAEQAIESWQAVVNELKGASPKPQTDTPAPTLGAMH